MAHDGNWREELQALDAAIYAAIAASPTPTFDRALGRLSRAADHAKLWLGAAALLAAAGGERGRAAAATGLVSLGTTSAVVNVVLKPLGRRRRPDPAAAAVPVARQVAMPWSTSFPSGHSASAFAFASGVAASFPAAGVPLRGLAALVAYSRLHTGVHYAGDVVAGSLVGGAIAPVATSAMQRRLRG
jgi:membrane-associated phospholipid phosphatase